MTLWSPALSILVEQLRRSLMGSVNAFTLSRLSGSAAAAAGVPNQALSVGDNGLHDTGLRRGGAAANTDYSSR